MTRWTRFRTGRGGGSYKPRFGGSEAWADQVLAANPALPRDPAYRCGLVSAHTLRQRPDSPGSYNYYTTDHEHAMWQQAYEHAQTLLPHYGL